MKPGDRWVAVVEEKVMILVHYFVAAVAYTLQTCEPVDALLTDLALCPNIEANDRLI